MVTCRTCALLRVRPDADGKVRIRKDKSYLCGVEIATLNLPKSVREYNTPRPSYMGPDEGAGCSYHVSKK